MTKVVWLGLFICMVFLGTKSFADSNGKYWSDVENLCMKYSTATHPPCNRSYGSKMMIEHIEYMCKGDKSCMKDSVNLCIQYSPATHPLCKASNGLAMVLGEVERSAEFYPLKEAKAAAP